jgi:hypothetical protein
MHFINPRDLEGALAAPASASLPGPSLITPAGAPVAAGMGSGTLWALLIGGLVLMMFWKR